MTIFYSMLNIAAVNSRIILLATKKLPTQYRNRLQFTQGGISSLGIQGHCNLMGPD